MKIVLDLGEQLVYLQEPDDFRAFALSVEGEGGPDDLARLVILSGLGRVQPGGGQVAVDPAALCSLAGPAVTDAWEEGLAAMCAYAAGKGWIEADGAILGHVEWRLGPA
jgi:hypothetical protein